MRVLNDLVVAVVIIFGAAIPGSASAASAADLSVGVRGQPDPAAIGSAITWTITVRNIGPGTAAGVKLAAGYGSDAGAVSAKTTQGTCVHSGGSVDFSLGSILDGGVVTATVVTSNFGGDGGTLRVSVSSTTQDPHESNNSAVGRVTTISGQATNPPVGTFCAPGGGIGTGAGGTANGSLAWLVTVGLLVAAVLLAGAVRFAKR